MRTVLKDVLNYSWQKANVRHPNFLKPGTEENKEAFIEFIAMLKVCNYTIVYIDECQFNAGCLPLYTWNKVGAEPAKVIRKKNDKCNCIAAQVERFKMFHIKEENTTEDSFIKFLTKLRDELTCILAKNQLEKRTVIVFDNASIHYTDKVKKFARDKRLVCFTIPPY